MMPIPKIASEISLQVERRPLQLFLHAGETEILTYILPPTDDLADVRIIDEQRTHLRRLNAKVNDELLKDFHHELALLQRKFETFKDSPTYLNRLASFAAMAGLREEEAAYLAQAGDLSGSPFYAHRLGENLVARGEQLDAARLFAGLDLQSDVYANLRLASFNVSRRDLVTARGYVDSALKIDPIDYGARVFDGGLCIIEQRLPEAIQSLRVALEQRPNSATVHSNMAIAYKRLGLMHKAVASAKMAVALDPVSDYFVAVLSDLAYEVGEDADALSWLKYYVQFDQDKADIWARLARACLRLNMLNDAEQALKREAAIRTSAGVWNNLGVCHHRRHNGTRALSAFKHAMDVSRHHDHDYFLAARNVVQTLSEANDLQEVVRTATAVLQHDIEGITLRTPALSDIHALRIQALLKMGFFDVARDLGFSILEHGSGTPELVVWVVAFLIGQLSMRQGFSDDVQTLISQYWLDRRERVATPQQWCMFVNNVAFAFAEAGNVRDAELALQTIGARINVDPYPTATLGLVHLRKGHIQRGKDLYERAIHLSTSASDKARIRQKLNLELGKYYAGSNETQSRRLLQRAIGVKGGEKLLEVEARDVLASLSRKSH